MEDPPQGVLALTLPSHLLRGRAVVIYKLWKNCDTLSSWEKRLRSEQADQVQQLRNDQTNLSAVGGQFVPLLLWCCSDMEA